MPHHANQTSFKPGFDPRRHVFTRAERQRGYARALVILGGSAQVYAWLWRKVRSYYRAQRRHANCRERRPRRVA